MPTRPCFCGLCHHCGLYRDNPRYRALWDGEQVPPREPRRVPVRLTVIDGGTVRRSADATATPSPARSDVKLVGGQQQRDGVDLVPCVGCKGNVRIKVPKEPAT